MGRKKIEMKIVKDRSSRQVTFSKRRNGLFKKANELATLCAAEVAIVVFSPGGKPFSFGNPSVDAVTQHFLNQASMQKPHAFDPKHESGVQDLNHELNDISTQLQIEKNRGKELQKAVKANTNELSQMKTKFEELREKMRVRASEIEASSSLLLLKNTTQQSDI